MSDEMVLAEVKDGNGFSEYFDGVVAEAINRIDPLLLSQTDQELEEKFKLQNHDFILRKNFTDAINKVKDIPGTKIHPPELYKNACNRSNFYNFVIKNPYRLAWLIRPLEDETQIKSGFYLGLKKAMEILQLPVDAKTAPVILKTLEFFTNRHLGPVIQRIEQKSMNLNVSREVVGQMDNFDPELMLQKYAEAKSKIAHTQLIEVKVDDKEEN